jgi:hypothetical protein
MLGFVLVVLWEVPTHGFRDFVENEAWKTSEEKEGPSTGVRPLEL